MFGINDFILLTPQTSSEEIDEFIDLTPDKTEKVWEQNVQKSFLDTFYYTAKSTINTSTTRLYSWLNRDDRVKGHSQTSQELVNFMRHVIGERDIHLVHCGCFTGVVNPDKLDFKKPHVIPILVDGIVGYHMTCFYINPEQNGEELQMEFFDGKGLHIDDPLNKNARAFYEAVVQKHPHQLTFKQLKKPKQFDVHNCGPLSAWFIDQRLKGFSFEDIEMMEAPDIEAYRTKLLSLSH